MTIDEIVQQLLQHADEYAVEGEELIPGDNGKMVMRKCKKIDVTLDLIIDFCYKYHLPLPEEFIRSEKDDN